mgnify:CR=1 FL=1
MFITSSLILGLIIATQSKKRRLNSSVSKAAKTRLNVSLEGMPCGNFKNVRSQASFLTGVCPVGEKGSYTRKVVSALRSGLGTGYFPALSLRVYARW